MNVDFNKSYDDIKGLKLNLKTRAEKQSLHTIADQRTFAGNYNRLSVDISSQGTVLNIDEQFLRKAIKIIEENINETGFTTYRFCKEIGVSRAHLYRKLKALSNQSATEFIRCIRLQKAAELLKQQTASVSEIAYRTGFNNLSYFSRRFKQAFGVVPSEYFPR